MRKRGEVWLANLDPHHGTEPGKTRPVLVVQAQALLDVDHPSTLIVPLTTNLTEGAEPLRIRIPVSAGIQLESDLLIDQLRAIDNRRLIKGPLATLTSEVMAAVGEAIQEVLDLAVP
ncbi:MAG: type II toxin-antitoxin system PemK/MazF family toxin [Chloroflexota bacterium]|nr:type II toxin-antitoxin system PemK/MazF family toxin [Chloroflexota bacterium]